MIRPLFLVLSRSRCDQLKRVLDQLFATTARAKVVIGFDLDDPEYDLYKNLCTTYGLDFLVLPPKEPLVNLPKRMNVLWKVFGSSGDYNLIIPFSDDCIIETRNWLDYIEMRVPNVNGFYIVYPNDGFRQRCTFPMLSAKVAHAVGYVGCEKIYHIYGDTFWECVGEQLGILYPCLDIFFRHLTPANGTGRRDAVFVEHFKTNPYDVEFYRSGKFHKEVENVVDLIRSKM